MISIIDYGMGNLRSVQKGFEKVGFEAIVTADPDQIRKSDKVVLPGVGAFEDAISELHRLELVDPIRELIDSGRPFLGICLGLQMLFDTSYENGKHAGLGIIPGKVVKFELPPEFSVPHMGWNQLHFRHKPPIFDGIDEGTHFYFVHSYYVVPDSEEVVAIESDYHIDFCAAVWRDNLYATQFHPEKSQSQGLAVLKNFAQL